MLTSEEFEQIQNKSNQGRLTKTQLLKLIEQEYVADSALVAAHKGISASYRSKDCVSKPRQNKPSLVDETRKTEIERGAKVRTGAESRQADRSNPM